MVLLSFQRYIVGECGGESNTLKCESCKPEGSEDEFCPTSKDGATQFREGGCSSALDGNEYTCVDQPNCDEGTVLFGFSPIKKGACRECRRTVCRYYQYRVGTCNGAVNNYECKDCDEDQPECDTDVGKEQYLVGECGTSGVGEDMTTSNTFECKDCVNRECTGDWEFRSGTCEEASNFAYFCNTQIMCYAGEYYKPGKDQDGGIVGEATCEACPSGQYRPTEGRESSCIPHGPSCGDVGSESYQKAEPTATSDRICSATKKCGASQYESRAPVGGEDRQCSFITTCVAGQYVARKATESSDQRCDDCWGREEYSNTDNAAECTIQSPCGVDEYLRVRGSATTDNVCNECSKGTHVDKPKHTQTSCTKDTTTATTTTVTTSSTSTATATTSITGTTKTTTSVLEQVDADMYTDATATPDGPDASNAASTNDPGNVGGAAGSNTGLIVGCVAFVLIVIIVAAAVVIKKKNGGNDSAPAISVRFTLNFKACCVSSSATNIQCTYNIYQTSH